MTGSHAICHPRAKRATMDSAARVIPAEAGIQPWGHDAATRIREPVGIGEAADPDGFVALWILAFARMTC
jgi:hypothetical protein